MDIRNRLAQILLRKAYLFNHLSDYWMRMSFIGSRNACITRRNPEHTSLMPQDASHTSFLRNLNTEPQAPHGKQNKALDPYSQGKCASGQVAGGARSLSNLVCCAISETHSVAGELPKVSTICKSINRA